jgi:hypothetical protein
MTYTVDAAKACLAAELRRIIEQPAEMELRLVV